MVPEGDISVTLPGMGGAGTAKDMPSLQGPYPFAFQVWTHHLPEPAASAVPGDTEQVPVPLEQLT